MTLTIVVFWFFFITVLAVVCYLLGVGVGFKKGTARGLELAWQRVSTASEEVLSDHDRRGRVTPQPLAIRYSIRTGGDASSTPLSGRLVFPDLTRADWTTDRAHFAIRDKLKEAYPGCEIIGYAVLDRTSDATFEAEEGGV